MGLSCREGSWFRCCGRHCGLRPRPRAAKKLIPCRVFWRQAGKFPCVCRPRN
jgi:hypothetical protein